MEKETYFKSPEIDGGLDGDQSQTFFYIPDRWFFALSHSKVTKNGTFFALWRKINAL